MQPVRYPPIAEVAQPMLRLAGLRIDIRTNGPHLPFYNTAYTIKRLSDASDIPVAASPGVKGVKLGAPLWLSLIHISRDIDSPPYTLC